MDRQQKANDKEPLQNIKRFYDDTYYKDSQTRSPSRHDCMLVRKLGITRVQTVLDVACGKGEWLQACSATGARVCGVDLSETAIAACRKAIPDGEFYSQEAERLPFPDEAFDIVTCLGSLEHFVNPEVALKEMYRVAKDDAKILILVPNAGFLTRRFGLFAGTCQLDAKEEVRPLDEWHNLFNSEGFDVLERWRDLHVLSWDWIRKGRAYQVPLRTLQALLLPLWPLQWQYQVFHLCRKSAS